MARAAMSYFKCPESGPMEIGMVRTGFIRAVLFAVGLVAGLAMPAQAEDVTAAGLKITTPWARATPKGASVGGGYMKITNTGNAPDRLIGGVSEISSRFEIHEMSMDNGVMKMRSVPGGIEIKPGQSVEFGPSGYHVMLVGLNRQLMQGDHFKAALEFAKAGKFEVDFTVESIGSDSSGD
jgi:copper(I)-binding protein